MILHRKQINKSPFTFLVGRNIRNQQGEKHCRQHFQHTERTIDKKEPLNTFVDV